MEVINLNLIPTGALPVVHASQYDDGRTFRANLMDGSTVYTLDGTEVLECDVKKPDGNIVTMAVTNTSDSYVEIDTTLQMCACAGDSLAELHIKKGAQEIGTLNFILAVERSPLEGGIESETEIHNLETQIADIVSVEVANQYDSSNVIFDNAPTAGHGNGYTVTSEGIGNAIDNALEMTDTASGAIATFESEYALPLRDLEIEINAVQESGTPTPSSPKLISGFTGANIHVADDENPHVIDNVTPITWQDEAGTVYGGSLDVTSGVLTVDKLIVDLSTIDFNTFSNPSIHVFRAELSTALPNVQTPPNTNTATTAICSKYVSKAYAPISSEDNGLFAISDSSTNRLIFIDHNCNTVEDFMTANADTQLLYPIATHITYQLTPTEISAIVGTNNVFTDTNGDTSLEYYTKRGEQTVRIAEGVAVDVINNKNIDTLHTTSKTLVGAVNEVNGKTTVIDVIPNITMQNGYTLANSRLIKVGQMLVGILEISRSTAFVNNEAMATLPYYDSNFNIIIPSFCSTTDRWNAYTPCNAFINNSNGNLQFASNISNVKFIRIPIAIALP